VKTLKLSNDELYLIDYALEKYESLCWSVVDSVKARKKSLATKQRKKLVQRYARKAEQCARLRTRL
jgi:hypothetical protein